MAKRKQSQKERILCGYEKLAFGSVADAIRLLFSDEFLPAHLICEFDFGSLSWDFLDAKENTFDSLDGLTLLGMQSIPIYRKDVFLLCQQRIKHRI